MRRIYTVNDYLKETFGQKTIKLSIDGGFTCPNRDGKKGMGGCIFCSESGSGEMASNIEDQIALLSDKWSNVNNYIAYFQSHTNTYDTVNNLREKYYTALNNPKISGIAISTRPDSIDQDALQLLEEINKEHFMWVELGLQTIHQETMKDMNLCYTLKDYDETISKLNDRGIKVVTHLILGLPGEDFNMMKESLEHVVKKTWGLKLHMLNIVKGSPMEKLYPNYQSFSSIEEYVNTVCNLLECTPSHIVMHRLTADVPRKLLISPEWSYHKRTILNGINNTLKQRGTYQGFALQHI